METMVDRATGRMGGNLPVSGCWRLRREDRGISPSRRQAGMTSHCHLGTERLPTPHTLYMRLNC